MSRCVIVSAAPFEDVTDLRERLREDDVVIAADGGLHLAEALGVVPQIIVADFDSTDPVSLPNTAEIIRLPVHKDLTDTAAAVNVALERGLRDFLFLGCLGGRLDHQFANLQLMASLAQQGCAVLAADGNNIVRAYATSPVTVEPINGWSLSVFAFGDTVHRLSVCGAAYELEDYDLSPFDSLCVSNETVDTPCHISFLDGTLFVIRSKD